MTYLIRVVAARLGFDFKVKTSLWIWDRGGCRGLVVLRTTRYSSRGLWRGLGRNPANFSHPLTAVFLVHDRAREKPYDWLPKGQPVRTMSSNLLTVIKIL
jgi:hypothetical protein